MEKTYTAVIKADEYKVRLLQDILGDEFELISCNEGEVVATDELTKKAIAFASEIKQLIGTKENVTQELEHELSEVLEEDEEDEEDDEAERCHKCNTVLDKKVPHLGFNFCSFDCVHKFVHNK